MFTAQEAARLSGGTLVRGNPEARVPASAKVTTDSRQVAPGDLFVALVGQHHDAHQFVPGAVRAGAVAVMVSNPQVAAEGAAVIHVPDTLAGLQQLAAGWRRGFRIPVAAITGSCGKTTTKEMARAVLSVHGHPHATSGNLNNHIGLPLTLLGLRPHHDVCVAELGINHPGEMDLLCGIAAPDLGLITCVGEAHLEGLGSAEGVAAEKGRLFAHVASGTAVVNLDDPYVAAQARQHPARRTVTYGSTRAADVQVRVENGGTPHLLLAIAGQEVRAPFFSAAPHQAQNAAAAAALGHALGVPPEAIARGLAAFVPMPMRGRELTLPSGARLIDDVYNANPHSVQAAAASLAHTACRGRRVVVVGDMLELGAEAERLHRETGKRIAALRPDRLICVGKLARQIAAGAAALPGVHTVDTPEAAAPLLADLTEGDIVLVKGSRGMSMERLCRVLIGAVEAA